jgi:hypothetical protein
MRFRSHLVGLLVVSLLLATSPAQAQQHVISSSDLQQSMIEKAAADASSRELVASVLRHESARDVAARLSLDLTKAQQAVATLDGEELASAVLLIIILVLLIN